MSIHSLPETDPFDGYDIVSRVAPVRDEELNGRQRLFAENIAGGMSPAQAWRDAGYISPFKNERAFTPGVDRLVAELRREHAERNRISVDRLILELEEARKLAMEKCQVAAAIAATMGKAKLAGLLVEHQRQDINLTISKPVRQPTDRIDLSVDDWHRIYAPPKVIDG